MYLQEKLTVRPVSSVDLSQASDVQCDALLTFFFLATLCGKGDQTRARVLRKPGISAPGPPG